MIKWSWIRRLLRLTCVSANADTLFGTARWAKLAIFYAIGPLALLPASVHAKGLECPEVSAAGVPALMSDESQIKRMTTANAGELGYAIGALIDRLKAENPTVTNDAITDTLIAAYCPVVAQMPNASTAEKWQLMRQFDRVLMQQLASAMPQGSLIIANVPLQPVIYETLSSRARAAGQTTVDLMAAILSRAAGQ
jgi:hypothetical protein